MYTRPSEYLEWIYDNIPTTYPCDDGLECLPSDECAEIHHRKKVVELTTSPVVKKALEQELERLRSHDISFEDIFADDFSVSNEKYCCKRSPLQDSECTVAITNNTEPTTITTGVTNTESTTTTSTRCTWCEWASWSSCSLTCGGGVQQRSRDVCKGARHGGGVYCMGGDTSTRLCNDSPCPGLILTMWFRSSYLKKTFL